VASDPWSLELLNDPVAEALLGSVNPARLAYSWIDGSPRMVPVWFHWIGDQFVLGSPPKTPKLKALAEDPRVAPGRGNSPQIACRSPESGDDFSPSRW